MPHPPLEWLEIDDVVVSGGALVRAGRRFLGGPDIAAALAVGGELKGPGIRAHADRTVLVDARRPGRRLPAGVPLTGFGAHNWYHWLVELLPRLQLLAGAPPEARTAPLIVPTSALGGPAGEALRLLAPDAELVGIGRDETLRLDRCWWIDSPVLGPRTFRAGWPATGAASAHHHATMARHRAALRVAVGLSGDGAAPEGGPAERLLLVRGGDAARWYRDVAERLGLRPVDPGGLTFVEQARTFARAEVVVGAWGAAWAGWLLAPRSARGLVWAPEAFRDWPLYANLTVVGGRELQHLFLPSASAAADFRPANRARPDPTPERLLEAFRLAGLDR